MLIIDKLAKIIFLSIVICYCQNLFAFSFNTDSLKNIKSDIDKKKKKATESFDKIKGEKDKLKGEYDKMKGSFNEKKAKYEEIKGKIKEGEEKINELKSKFSDEITENQNEENNYIGNTPNKGVKIHKNRTPLIVSENLNETDHYEKIDIRKKHLILILFFMIMLFVFNISVWVLILKNNIFKEYKLILCLALFFLIILNFFIMLFSNIFENNVEFTFMKDILLLANTFSVGFVAGKNNNKTTTYLQEIP